MTSLLDILSDAPPRSSKKFENPRTINRKLVNVRKESLSPWDVLDLVARRRAGESVAQLAVAYDLTRQAVHMICVGDRWSRVTGITPKSAKSA